MEKIKTDFLSKLLYWIAIGGILLATIVLITLPWYIEIIFKDSAFYAVVEHYQVLVLLYMTGIPAWLILWETKGLARNIMMRTPFSDSSCTCLKVISICALFIFFCYLFTCIFLRATFGILVVTVGAFMVALIAAILHRLVAVAIEIKEENELTI